VVRANATTTPLHPTAHTGVLQSVIATEPPTIETVAPRPTATATATDTHSHRGGGRRLVTVVGTVAVALALATAALAGWRWRAHRAPAINAAAATTTPPATTLTPTVTASPVAASPGAVSRAPAHPTKRPAAVHARPAGPGAVEPAHLTVNATPWGSIYIDGRRIADETPLYRFALRPGDHVVQVRFGDDRATARAERVHVGAGEMRTLGFRR
ncbi:MAG: hypothetical protein ACXVDD_13955, partial [Polyangia bacterium]